MSKVTIKFWDKPGQEYWEEYFVDRVGLVINRHGAVVDEGGYEFMDVEPHFYKDGERIDE